MESIGIRKNDHIILYAQPSCFYSSTRALAVLSLYGFSNVKILNGGFKTYCDENLPVEPGKEYTGSRSTISGLELDKSHLVEFEKVHEFAEGNLNFLI